MLKCLGAQWESESTKLKCQVGGASDHTELPHMSRRWLTTGLFRMVSTERWGRGDQQDLVLLYMFLILQKSRPGMLSWRSTWKLSVQNWYMTTCTVSDWPKYIARGGEYALFLWKEL